MSRCEDVRGMVKTMLCCAWLLLVHGDGDGGVGIALDG